MQSRADPKLEGMELPSEVSGICEKEKMLIYHRLRLSKGLSLGRTMCIRPTFTGKSLTFRVKGPPLQTGRQEIPYIPNPPII